MFSYKTTATKVTERVWRCREYPERVKSQQHCSAGVFRALSKGSCLCTACNSDLHSTFHSGTSCTPARATTAASGWSQLWNSIKGKCCLMFHFLSTNIKERGEKRECWGAGEEGEKSQLLLQKLQFLSKNLSLTSLPSKHFVMHISVWL